MISSTFYLKTKVDKNLFLFLASEVVSKVCDDAKSSAACGRVSVCQSISLIRKLHFNKFLEDPN